MNFKHLARLARMPADDDPEPAPAKRRRPATRKGRPTLTRELIAESALEIAGTEGFPAVTMRRLAEELEVTVRALYRYVDERQEVVDLAAALFLSRWEVPPLDPGRWQEGLRTYLEHQRALYRRHPRALLVSLDEQVSPASTPTASGTRRRCSACCAARDSARATRRTSTATWPRGCSPSPCSSTTPPTGAPPGTPERPAPSRTAGPPPTPASTCPTSPRRPGSPRQAPDELFEELVRSVLADVTARLERGSEPG